MANRSQSHFRKPSRLANSANQRGSSGRGGEGAAATGLPPPPSSSNSHSSSFSTNRSFKKSSGQGTQSWVIAASANSDSNAPVARAVQNAAPSKSPSLDATMRPSESSNQRSNRAVPKVPSSHSRSGSSDSTAPTTTTQGDASKVFSLQFGSFVNRVQVPPRTSSAPPNLVEQKHDQALHDSLRSVPVIPISSIPREQQLRKDVQQSNGRESPPRPQAIGDLHTQVPAAPAITNTQGSSTLPPTGVSMAIPLQKQQVPSQLRVPSPHIQSQGLTTTSLQMPMSLPLGTSAQVQQQVFVPGIQGHSLQHQRMVHHGHGLHFSPHVSHQLGTQLGNLGIGFNPQFSQQQTPRITVKITHPDTHEELRLDKWTNTNLFRVSKVSPYSSVLSTDCSEIRSPILEASKRGSLCLDSQEIPHRESSHTPAPVVSASVSKLGQRVSENANAGVVQITMLGSKDKPILEVNRGKSTTVKGKKKRRELLRNADAVGTTSNLCMAYKGPNEKPEPAISSESVDSMSGTDARQVSLDLKEKDVRVSKEDEQSEAEPDDWEDAADIASPKLKISDNAKQVHGGLQRLEEDVDGVTGRRKYSRDFLLKFPGQCTDLPADCEIRHDLMEALQGSKVSISNNFESKKSKKMNKKRREVLQKADAAGTTSDLYVAFKGQNEKPEDGQSAAEPNDWEDAADIASPKLKIRQYGGEILSGPLFPQALQGRMQRNGLDADRWQRGLIPSPQSPLQVMHKATNKYEIRQVTEEEEAKQRQLKAILNKLTPQNFEKLFEKVKEINIDNADTLSSVISQIFDKALMEPTFCEMYANFCYYLADVLPDFTNDDNEKITFKRLLLNKC